MCWGGQFETIPVYYHNLPRPVIRWTLLASDWSVQATHALWLVTVFPLSSVGADSPTPWHGWPPIIMLMPPSVWPVTISQSEARVVTIWPIRGQCHRLGTPAPSHQSVVMCVLVLWRPLDIANQFYERLVLARASLCQIWDSCCQWEYRPGQWQRSLNTFLGFCLWPSISLLTCYNSHNFPGSESQTTKSVTNRSCFVKTSHKRFNFYTLVFLVRGYIFR